MREREQLPCQVRGIQGKFVKIRKISWLPYPHRKILPRIGKLCNGENSGRPRGDDTEFASVLRRIANNAVFPESQKYCVVSAFIGRRRSVGLFGLKSASESCESSAFAEMSEEEQKRV